MDDRGADLVKRCFLLFIFVVLVRELGKGPENEGSVLYIESPTMIETIMLKVHTMIRKLGDEPKMVFLDSVNTLSLHNDEKVMQEFVHYLINALRVRKVPSVVLSIVDQTPEDLEIIHHCPRALKDPKGEQVIVYRVR